MLKHSQLLKSLLAYQIWLNPDWNTTLLHELSRECVPLLASLDPDPWCTYKAAGQGLEGGNHSK